MAYYEAVAILGLLLCTSVCAAGELRISGNESPLYIGVSRTITCTWTGEENVIKTMNWYSVKHDLKSSGNSKEQGKSQNKEIPIERNIRIIETFITLSSAVNSIELNTTVNSIELNSTDIDKNWDRKRLKCKAVTTTGDIKETSVPLTFKDIYVKINITYDPPAGFNLLYPYYKNNTHVNLTCQVQGASGFDNYKWSSDAPFSLAANNHSQTLSKVLTLNDTGNHTCTVENINGSTVSNTTKMQIIALIVDIKMAYKPPADFTLPSPPYFRPATSVTLTCQVEQASEDVSYQWTSTNPKSFVVNHTSSTVRKTILTSDDAGNHTCTATDSSGNSNSSTIKMQMIGGGIFVSSSKNFINMSVENNSVIFLKTSKCSYCKVSFYCYSNSSETNFGYIIFPNAIQYYGQRRIHGVEINAMSPSGIRLRNSALLAPSYEGVYTCRLLDSNDNILDISIAYYRICSNIPDIYYRKFSFQSKKGEKPHGMFEIRTRYSPPTNVTWQKDGAIVHAHPHMEEAGYEMTQILTNRRHSYYTTYLQIRNISHLVGSHVYTCNVENNCGNTSKNISTHVQVDFKMDISPPKKVVYLKPLTLKCNASIIQSRLAEQLMQYAKLEWLNPVGEVMSNNNNPMIEEENVQNNLTSTIHLKSVFFRHKGKYICRSIFDFPGEGIVKYNQTSTTIDVIASTIIQLKVGPLSHCSQWYKDENITKYLERDIRTLILDVLDKNCNYTCKTNIQISDVEFSCQTYVSCVTFRANLTGSNNDMLTVSKMTAAITKWLNADATFIYNYDIPIRLRADPGCPIQIEDFSDEECMGKECHDTCYPKE